MTSAVIYKNCNLTKQFGSKILNNEFLDGNISMTLAIVKPSLVPVKSYNKFNQGKFQKNDIGGKSQDICQERTVTSGHTKIKDSWKHSDNMTVYTTSLW